jgi:hypothetical protein
MKFNAVNLAKQAQSQTGEKFGQRWGNTIEAVKTETREGGDLAFDPRSAYLNQPEAPQPKEVAQKPQKPQLPEQAAPQATQALAKPSPYKAEDKRSPVEAETKAFEWKNKLPPKVRSAVEQWKASRAFVQGFKKDQAGY